MDPGRGFLELGTEVAGYRIEAFIGRGGMAVVYRAEDLRLGRNVALKLLAPELSANESFQQRFIRESRVAASIDHPNIIPLYEAGEMDGLLFIVMRYVVGSDLKVLLQREGPLEPGRLVGLFRQIGGALDAAHAGGLVHRDVKPGNILVASGAGPEDQGHVYLTDFGLTKRSASLSGVTATGHFIGTIDYVAPEQITGNPVDGRTDIYALGCVLYECLTGSVPFQREDDAGLLWAHMVEPPPKVSPVRPELPESLDAVVAKAMAKAPEERYATCREMMYDLQAELAEYMAPGPTGRSATAGSPRLGEPAGRGSAAPASGAVPGAVASAPPPPAPPVEPPPVEPPPAPSVEPPPPAPVVEPADELAGRAPGPVMPPPVPPPPVPGPPALDEPAVAEAEASLSRPAPVRRRPSGRLLLLALAAVLVLAAVPTALWLRSQSGDRLTVRSPQDQLVPFSFKHPAGWRRQESGINVVFSPKAGDLIPLFSQKGTGGTWQPVHGLLKSDPKDVVGLASSFTSTQVDAGDPDQLKAAVQPLLPAASSFTSGPDQLLVGGYAADRLEGELSDPGAPGDRLHFSAVVVQAQRPEPRTVYLIFFAPADRFEDSRPLFEHILQSVNFFG